MTSVFRVACRIVNRAAVSPKIARQLNNFSLAKIDLHSIRTLAEFSNHEEPIEAELSLNPASSGKDSLGHLTVARATQLWTKKFQLENIPEAECSIKILLAHVLRLTDVSTVVKSTFG